MPNRTCFFFFCLAATRLLGAQDVLTEPLKVVADGTAIDVSQGHAAPFVGDFDGDGNPDLLVGQFGDGKLQIFMNIGRREDPKFGAPAWFQASGNEGRVPAG